MEEERYNYEILYEHPPNLEAIRIALNSTIRALNEREVDNGQIEHQVDTSPQQ